jgi:hypothetical protein
MAMVLVKVDLDMPSYLNLNDKLKGFISRKGMRISKLQFSVVNFYENKKDKRHYDSME